MMEQLQTMHQPLDTPEESEPSSRPAQASPGNGASVMQLMSTMARKPHWQKGKMGEYPQPGSFAPASLLAQQAALSHDLRRDMHASMGQQKPELAASHQDTWKPM